MQVSRQASLCWRDPRRRHHPAPHSSRVTGKTNFLTKLLGEAIMTKLLNNFVSPCEGFDAQFHFFKNIRHPYRSRPSRLWGKAERHREYYQSKIWADTKTLLASENIFKRLLSTGTRLLDEEEQIFPRHWIMSRVWLPQWWKETQTKKNPQNHTSVTLSAKILTGVQLRSSAAR